MASTATTPNIFGSTAPSQEGVRVTETVHRKIELQDPADWTYLLANVTKAAREKIEKYLPTASSPEGEVKHNERGDDEMMRERVSEGVDEYIRTTYDAVKDSILINGMNAREMEAELAKHQEGEGEYQLEPYDGRLAQRIQELSAQVEEQTLLLANLRRKAPKDTAGTFRKSFEARSTSYDQKVKAGEEAEMNAARAMTLNIGSLQRTEDMKHFYEKGTEGLSTLKDGMGGVVARLEKAQKAFEVLEEGERR